MPAENRKKLAKALKGILGSKKQKGVSLSAFTPQNAIIFEQAELEKAVEDFRTYLQGNWEEGCYLKLEK